MIRAQAEVFVRNTDNVRFMEFGDMLAGVSEMHTIHGKILQAHQAGMEVLDRYNIKGGRIKEIYKRAHELGVPEDAPDMFR